MSQARKLIGKLTLSDLLVIGFVGAMAFVFTCLVDAVQADRAINALLGR